MSLVNEIHENHQKLDNLTCDGMLYFSRSMKKFYHCNDDTTEGLLHELPSQLSCLVYETELASFSRSFLVKEPTLSIEISGNPPVPYSTDLYRVDKISKYGLNHSKTLISAVLFAACHHKKQLRKSNNEPYFIHLAEVLNLVQVYEPEASESTLTASVLHDVVEDTHVSIEGVKFLFGEDVFKIVVQLTYSGASTSAEKKRHLLNQIQEACTSAKIIKLADISSNISTIPTSWDNSRKLAYISWCDQVAELCKSASTDLYHYYMKRREHIA